MPHKIQLRKTSRFFIPLIFLRVQNSHLNDLTDHYYLNLSSKNDSTPIIQIVKVSP